MSEQRYRPLAFGERIEEGDECKSTENLPGVIYKWGMAYGHEGNRVGDIDGYTYRRPIPETNWREPVGEAGYPYPQGTVVQTIGKVDQSIIETVLLPNGSTRTLHDNQVYVGSHFGSKCKHRVIDYRPDLLAQETPADETQTNLSCTDETQDLLPCPFCGSSDITSYALGNVGSERDVHVCQSCFAEGPQRRQTWNTRSESAELTRLRAEVERYVAECERLRIKCGKSEMVEGDYATLCILTDERDKLRVRVECWEAKWKSLLKMHTEVINLMEKHSE